jgi:hypothetical protein
MEISNEILSELREISPFWDKGARHDAPYALPGGYFEEFPAVLLNRIRFETAGVSDPDSALETAGISPLLASLQKRNPYQVPAGYFEDLKASLPSAEPATPLRHIVPAYTAPQKKRNPFILRTVKYAVAACLVGLLGITIYNVNSHQIADPIHGLTKVSDQDIANYLDADDIHWTPGVAPETASVEFTDNDIHALFSNVSDAELEQYHPLPLKKGNVN